MVEGISTASAADRVQLVLRDNDLDLETTLSRTPTTLEEVVFILPSIIIHEYSVV
jgi:hypothetical protein